jgi:GntR family transcriptional regulator
MEIDPLSRVPAYWQIQEKILKEITDGVLKPGDKILSEHQLSEKYQVSRPTARSAVTELVNKGYLFRKQGRGTFVQKPRIENSQENFHGFKADMEARGFTVKSEVLNAERVSPTSEIQETLQLASGDAVFRIKRLRFANSEAIVIHESFIPEKFAPGLLDHDFSQESLYTLLKEEHGIYAQNATEHLEAVSADSKIAEYLAIKKGNPILFIKRIAFIAMGTPFEYSQSWYRGDRYIFDIHLQRK